MIRLLAAICLMGVAGLLLVGGCTPESDNTWSDSLDFSDMDPRLADMTSTYYITQHIDAFDSLTILQTGQTVQGYDNMQRSWRGTITGSSPPGTGGYVYPQLQLQTDDGPMGQATLVLTGTIFVDDEGNCFMGFDGMYYTWNDSEYVQGLGPGCPCATD